MEHRKNRINHRSKFFCYQHTNLCNNEVSKKMKLEEGVIETKKKHIHEQDARSNVLTMNIVASNSEKVDEMLTELKIYGTKHASFAHAASEENLRLCIAMK